MEYTKIVGTSRFLHPGSGQNEGNLIGTAIYHMYNNASLLNFSKIVTEIKDTVPQELLHPGVQHFVSMIRTRHEQQPNLMLEILKHPAVSTEQQRFMLLIGVYDLFEARAGYLRLWRYGRVLQNHDVKFKDWFSFLQNEWPCDSVKLQKIMDNGGDGGDKTKNEEQHVRCIYFMRNSFEHINENTRGIPLKKLSKTFDAIMPEFASYVFERYITGRCYRNANETINADGTIKNITFNVFKY